MTILPEKNDIDINKLFSWGKTVEIYSPTGEIIPCYIRVIGDAQLNRARVYALRESAVTRRLLKDKNSDENIAYIPDIEELEKDKIVEFILASEMKDFTEEALKNVNVPFPKEPKSDAKLEQREKYQKAIDDYPDKLNSELNKYINGRVEKERKIIDKQTKEVLYQIYVDRIINDICQNEMYMRFMDMCVYFGSFKDADYTIPFYESLEQFQQVPSKIKDSLIKEYQTLDINLDDLKKLPGATQS
jgi:hypothetical protein